jgi:hypothetical protein
MFKITCKPKPKLLEPSLKQRQMLIAYQLDITNRNWPRLRAKPTPIQAVYIVSSEENTPVTPNNTPR